MFEWLFKTSKKTARESLLPAQAAPQALSSASAKEAADRMITAGNRAESAGDLREAREQYRKAVDAAPGYAPAHLNLGIGLEAVGDTNSAIDSYDAALAIDPGNAYASYNLGKLLYTRGALERAERLLRLALECKPQFPEAQVALSNVYDSQGNLPGAATALEAALEQRPDYMGALYNYGVILTRLSRLSEAESVLRRATEIDPEYVDAHINLGAVFRTRGKLDDAVACYQRALSLSPDSPILYSDLGNMLAEQGKRSQAMACYQQALALKPDLAETHFYLANVLRDEGRLEEAIDCYQKAIALRPDLPEAHSNLGNVLRGRDRLDEAIACYHKALALEPDFAGAHCNLGSALLSQGRRDEAIACYRKALALKPDFAEAHCNLGNIFREQGRLSEAFDCYRTALSRSPEYVEARWSLTMSQLPPIHEADADPGHYRAAFSRELDELDRWFDAARVASGFKPVGLQTPFFLAYQEENNRDLLRRYGNLCARIMSGWFDRLALAPSGNQKPDSRIRVGIVSQHIRKHSVWDAIVKGWFQQLDRERFSIHAFHLGLDEDEETLFAKSHATHFERGQRGLQQWVEAIAGQQPDVLVYPEVGMDPTTVELASLRLAPVQVATWGHPETTGLPTIDYYVSAESLEPNEAEQNYTEQLVALPHLGCFYQPARVVAAHPDLPGLSVDPDLPLLLCPGVPFKYAPQYDWIFAEIARRLGRCQFVFFTHDNRRLSEKLRQRLEVAFTRTGLNSADFAIFIPWQNPPAFYGLLKHADVFLDTIGFSGFNTAMQAVECSLPIVTREGRFMRGRLASGILKRIDLQELVVDSEQDYVALAVKLVQDVGYREHIRARIEANRHILFEDTAPIRALEDFFVRTTMRRES